MRSSLNQIKSNVNFVHMSAGRNFINQLFDRAKNVSDVLTVKHFRAIKWQERTLRKMLFKARNTAFGREYGFEDLLLEANPAAAFRSRIPIVTYEGMRPWWQRQYQGESDITWPGSPKYFALSSGTTAGSSKYIPVGDDQLKAIKKAGLRQMFAIAKTDIPKDFFTKHYLMIGGSTDLQYNGFNYSGDLSGITMDNVPFWMDYFTKPTDEIKREKDWHQKIDIMVKEAPNWDVSMIAGGPAWVKMLLEKVIAHYGLNNIHEIWPHFSVYSWGAVSLAPYKDQIDSMLGKPIMYFETYLASEGFIAYQNRLNAEGMTLALRNMIFFEFIPFDEQHFSDSGEPLDPYYALGIADVQEGIDYAIVITTCGGAWRYLIGDTVRFVNLDACEIKITGRTKQFLSICGEHLSVDNMNDGVLTTAQHFGFHCPEFTVKGYKNERGEMSHRWFLSCDKLEIVSTGEEVKHILDTKLSELNDDYATERKHVLTNMHLHLFPEQVFLDFMDRRGKLGGQAKFPRVMPDAMYAEWLEFLNETQPNWGVLD